MVIYIDELFINNFLLTYLIIIISAKMLNISYRHAKIILASILSTILTILLIIYDLDSNIVNRFIVIICSTYIAFMPKKIETFAVEVVSILIITFLIGGLMNSSLNNMYEIMLYGMIIILGLKKYNDYLKRKRWKARNKYHLKFNIEEYIVELNAFLDTGNFLATSLLSEPVIVISEEAAKDKIPKKVLELLKYGEISNLNFSMIKNIRPICYSTVNLKESMSYGLKVKNVEIKYNDNIILNDAVIILAKEKIRDFDALIGIALLEGGFENGNTINFKTTSKEIVC